MQLKLSKIVLKRTKIYIWRTLESKDKIILNFRKAADHLTVLDFVQLLTTMKEPNFIWLLLFSLIKKRVKYLKILFAQ